MKNFRKIIIFLVLMFVYSCATKRAIVPLSYNVPIRDISYADKLYTKNFNLYGYVLLNNPGKDSLLEAKNANFARAYFSILRPSSEYPNVAVSNLMVTYWLVNVTIMKKINVEEAFQYYDYARAALMFAAINKLDKTGPFLIAWKSPFEMLNKESVGNYLYLDLSYYDSNDMDRAVLLWRKMMSNPDSDLENAVLRFREDMRDLINKYGGSLVDLITKKKT